MLRNVIRYLQKSLTFQIHEYVKIDAMYTILAKFSVVACWQDYCCIRRLSKPRYRSIFNCIALDTALVAGVAAFSAAVAAAPATTAAAAAAAAVSTTVTLELDSIL